MAPELLDATYPDTIVLTVPRRGLALTLVPATVLCIVVTVALIPHPAGWLALALTVILAAVTAAVLARPGRLTIDTTGFESSHLGIVRRWSWAGTSNYRVRLRGRIPNVYFDADKAEIDSAAKRIYRKLGGSLPRYGADVNELVATLHAYRQQALQ